MCNTIVHRGPDDYGADTRGGVALGMRRLSIIDVAGGHQPIFNEDGTVWCVFNGEIYNFQELRKTLLSKGHKFQTRCDTEVIVHAYEEFGKDFPSKLNGMFAIALHDSTLNRLILARDHIGIKPLYYATTKEKIIFGSEIKVLLASGLLSPGLNLDALNEFLAWEYVPGQGTLFDNIFKLKPAELLDIDLNDPVVRPHPYWDVPDKPEDSNLTELQWLEMVDSKIKQCVNRQLVSDVPLGAFLSGGVDSSLIVNAMGEAQTFSIGFEDPSYNELPWAQMVASHLGVHHSDAIIKPDISHLFERLMYFMDDPIGDFSIFPTFLVSKHARKHVTVALSGDGGDELFGGYETYLANQKAGQYERLPLFLRRGIEPIIHRIRPQSRKKGLINKAKRFLEGLTYPSELSHARWRLFAAESLCQDLFTQDALRSMQEDRYRHILDLSQKARKRQPINRGLYIDLKSYLCDNILVKVDRMSMAVSLETRVPYLDYELVELAFKVPDHFKVQSNDTKILLKKVASRYIPRECIYRPKEGFSIPIKNWLRAELRPVMEDLLDASHLRQQGIFNSNAIEQLKQEHLTNRENHSHVLWALIVFQSWHKKWLSQ